MEGRIHALTRGSSEALEQSAMSLARRERELHLSFERDLARQQSRWEEEMAAKENERKLRAKVSSSQTDPIPGAARFSPLCHTVVSFLIIIELSTLPLLG